MWVYVDVNGAISVRDLDNFRSLSIVGSAELSTADLDRVLKSKGVGHLSLQRPNHVMLSIEWLRRSSVDPEWLRGFDAMIAYAESREWISEDRAGVLVHIEPSSEDKR